MNPVSFDWVILWPILVAVLTMIGGAVAWTNGAFRTRRTDQQENQKVRDDAATRDAALTLTRVSWLVEQLQEEVGRKGDALVASEQRCSEQIHQLDAKVAELKSEVATLNRKVGDLERELRDR